MTAQNDRAEAGSLRRWEEGLEGNQAPAGIRGAGSWTIAAPVGGRAAH